MGEEQLNFFMKGILHIETISLIYRANQKILNSVVVGARQIFNFSDKKPGFLEIIEIYLNLGIGFCITRLVLPNYKNISP